jgi:putative ABC transport system permease protein
VLATTYVFAGQSTVAGRPQLALTRIVTRDYFQTVNARLREGRLFSFADRKTSSPVAIVNETLADLHFKGESPIGKRLQFGVIGSRGYWYTIVGVVKEIRDRGIAEDLRPAIYRVHEQGDQSASQPTGIVVRTSLKPESIVPAIRQAVWSIDRNQPIARIRTMDEIVAGQLSVPSQDTTLMGAFAILALLLASIGLYGVVSYAVTQRTGEIGIRMAMGATSRSILLLFCGRGLLLTSIGLAIGLVLAAEAAHLMKSVLYGAPPAYFSAALIVSIILLMVAVPACLVPACRASRVDTLRALRCG